MIVAVQANRQEGWRYQAFAKRAGFEIADAQAVSGADTD
jgi:hypothetical protein